VCLCSAHLLPWMLCLVGGVGSSGEGSVGPKHSPARVRAAAAAKPHSQPWHQQQHVHCCVVYSLHPLALLWLAPWLLLLVRAHTHSTHRSTPPPKPKPVPLAPPGEGAHAARQRNWSRCDGCVCAVVQCAHAAHTSRLCSRRSVAPTPALPPPPSATVTTRQA
jgi:hypothetical protein